METSDLQRALREALSADTDADARDTLATLFEDAHPARIADALEGLPLDERLKAWPQVPTTAKGEVLTEVHGGLRGRLIEAVDTEELVSALQPLEMDELADLDVDVPERVMTTLLERMDETDRQRYELLKAYPDDSAGGLMDVDATAVRVDADLGVVQRYLRALRQRDGELPEHLDSLVVVDRTHTYLGILKLSDVVSLPAETAVADVYDTRTPALPVLTSAHEVAAVFTDRDLLSTAVVDEDGRLVGRITVDDVVDVMREEAEREIMSRAGLPESTDTFEPVLSNAARRAVWLGVNLINALLAAWVIGLFERSIEQIVALAVLMPVVASMGGVAGNQTLTLVTRGLALDQISRANAMQLLWREVASGALNGVLWAVIVGIVAVVWFGDPQLGLVFGMAMIINLLTGATVGSLVPLGLNRMGIDPALAGGVLLIAVTDVVGFVSFLGLATLVLL